MTVPSEQSRIQYTTDGTSVSFPVPFRFLNAAHLQVARQHKDESSILELGVDYSVSGVGNQAGGTITTTTTLPAGDSISIERVVPITQETAYQRNDPFPERAHEQALDKLTMICQMLGGVLGLTPGSMNRALLLGAADTDGKGSYRANGNRISNLGAPKSTTDGARLQDILDRLSDLATDGSGQFVVERLADPYSSENGANMVATSGGGTVQGWIDSAQEAIDILFKGEGLAKIAAMCRAGMPVKIAIYGDSTVDGHRTTGWTRNPTDSAGNAIPNHNHNPEAPNSWPVLLQALLRSMSGSGSIDIYNCGFGGKAVVDGWAERNYPTVIENHSTNHASQFVFVVFGINDSSKPEFTEMRFSDNLESLVRKVIDSGRIPILVTPDATIQVNEDQNMLRISGEVSTSIRVCAKKYRLDVIDMGAVTKGWLSNSKNSLDTPADLQGDGVHFGDRGHEFKAGAAAREIFKDYVITAKEGDTVGFWFGRITSRDRAIGLNRAVKNRMGCAYSIGPGVLHTEMSRLWVWLDEQVDGYYCSPDRDSQDSDDKSQIRLYDASGVLSFRNVIFGDYAYATSDRPADLNSSLGTLKAGLVRISYTANTLQNNAGYIRFGGGTPLPHSAIGSESRHTWSIPSYNSMPVVAQDGNFRSVSMNGALFKGFAFLFSTNKAFANNGAQSGYISLGVLRNDDNTVSLCLIKNINNVISFTTLAKSTLIISADIMLIEVRMAGGGGTIFVDIDGIRFIVYSKPSSLPMLPTYGVAGGVAYVGAGAGDHDKVSYHSPPAIF